MALFFDEMTSGWDDYDLETRTAKEGKINERMSIILS
jgi:hypothetical protein